VYRSGFNFAPRLQPAPTVAAGAGGTLELTLQFTPAIWPDQQVDIFVGSDPFQPRPFTGRVTTLTLPITGASRSEMPVPVRLRVDRIDSNIVRDRSQQPPQFDPQQSITLPA